MKIRIASKEIIHFIGIGGIGMSGLAQIMKNMGFRIQGSDLVENKNIDKLRSLGIKVFIGHSKTNIKNISLAVISSAIKINNEEYAFCKKYKIPTFKRSHMLANIISLKKNIIVTGSHGKTTTTSLISHVLVQAGLDPTVINGGVINSIKNNAKLGKGDWSVVEADESDGSFLHLPITYSVVTNIDREHLDYYKNFANLKKSFKTFFDKTPSFGKSFACIDDINIKNILKQKVKNYFTYGKNPKSDFQITNIRKKINSSAFDVSVKAFKKRYLIKNININLLGEHNIRNATVALAISLNLGIKEKIIKNALKKFMGIQRRFTHIFSYQKKDFYDDYAHHPTEIKSVLESVKGVYKKRKIISVFQPHRYSRVKSLKEEFSKSFIDSDEIVLCPVYAAGEKIDKKFNLVNFGQKIAKNSKKQVVIVNDKTELLKYFIRNLTSDEIVVCMGAGSISSWLKEISHDLKR